MALTVKIGVAELAETRFAVSALSEVVAGLQQLGSRDPDPGNLHWILWAQNELSRAPIELHHTWPLLVSTWPNWPEFLVPAPQSSSASIDSDLDALIRTPTSDVRHSITQVFGEDLPEIVAFIADQPATGLQAIASELRVAFNRLIAPHWPRIRAVIDGDIQYRSRQLAISGAGGMFASLHEDLKWQDGQLSLTGPRWRAKNAVADASGGLVLMPVVLASPYVLIRRRTSTKTTVRYPARGRGSLWNDASRRPRTSVVRLLGRARAEILQASCSPITTTELAKVLDVTPSAVSQHLRVLRETGLIRRERSGRMVLYLTTKVGFDLLQIGNASANPIKFE